MASTSLKALKTLQTFLMEYMGAAEDRLLLESQIVVANGAWLLIIEPLQ
jgi:hypothetical protein